MSNEHFNLIAGIYNKVSSFSPSPQLLESLYLQPKGILLDAGGGTGRVAAILHEYTETVVVADLSLGMLRYSHQKGLNCVNTSMESIPLNSDSVDRIIMMDTFHHLENQEQSVSELYRVLKPRGRLLIVEPNIEKNLVKLIAIAEKILLMRSHFMAGNKIADLFSRLNATVLVNHIENSVYVTILKQ